MNVFSFSTFSIGYISKEIHWKRLRHFDTSRAFGLSVCQVQVCLASSDSYSAKKNWSLPAVDQFVLWQMERELAESKAREARS